MSAKNPIEGARRSDMLRVPPDKLFIVGIDADAEGNVDGPDHPLYDERVKLSDKSESFEGLVKSIIAVGIIEPVVFRKNGDRAEIMVGRQRVRAAREAQKRLGDGADAILVPAYQRAASDGVAAETMAAENEIRQQSSPMVRARTAERMLARGLDDTDVARAFGIGVLATKRIVQLLELDKTVQKAIDTGRITQTAALELVGLTRAKQEEALKDLLAGGQKPTREKTKAKAKDKKSKTLDRRPSRTEMRRAIEVSAEVPQDTAPAGMKTALAMLRWLADGDSAELDSLGLLGELQKLMNVPKQKKKPGRKPKAKVEVEAPEVPVPMPVPAMAPQAAAPPG